MWLSISEGFQDKLALSKQIVALLGLEISGGGQRLSRALEFATDPKSFLAETHRQGREL